MDLTLSPTRLHGTVCVPSSKSMAQRLLLCSFLAEGTTKIRLHGLSEDISVMVEALRTLGAEILEEKSAILITSVKSFTDNFAIHCEENGACLRFLLPIAAALGIRCEFTGTGHLRDRPIAPLLKEMHRHGAFLIGDKLPIDLMSPMQGGEFRLPGDISSQFISGVLMALPLLGGSITLTSPLQSSPYVEMTKEALAVFGICTDGLKAAKQPYRSPKTVICEGDWSLGAIWHCFRFLGNEVAIDGLSKSSRQGDKRILALLRDFPQEIDVSDIPDLAPLLAILGTHSGIRLQNADRLRYKESNRAEGIVKLINSLGGEAAYAAGTITVRKKALSGGTAVTQKDHRLVFAAALAANLAEGTVTIPDADAVKKSYPAFWQDYCSLGGCADEH